MLSAFAALMASGCHSAFVQTTITNQGQPIRNFEMDYPSQGFGTAQLATSQVFRYRFKVQGKGPVKLQFIDAAGKSHTATGPVLDEKTEGTLTVTISPAGEVAWSPDLHISQ